MPRKTKPNSKGRTARIAGAVDALRSVWAWANRLALPLVVVLMVASSALAYGPLRRRVGAVRADPVRVVIRWPAVAGDVSGTWLPADEQDRLRRIALAGLTPDPFDTTALAETREALARTGWFKTPPTLRRRPAGVVEVRGDWRAPAAVVRTGSWDRLVADDGALLPLRYPEGGAGDLPVIVRPYAAAPRRPDGAEGFGLIWPGGDVPAAIRLHRFLRSSPHAARIAAIDVSRYVPEGELVVVMDTGGRIVWGSAPGAGRPGEASDEIKRQRFERVAGDPSLVAGDRPPVEIHTRYVLIDESASP
ncbi:MAG: hypothetical protein D6693_10780 [Planctomycetota bacterium]|nr:MAG: hypothetical protein D6693_10780 [Planctomycetota bacterium]